MKRMLISPPSLPLSIPLLLGREQLLTNLFQTLSIASVHLLPCSSPSFVHAIPSIARVELRQGSMLCYMYYTNTHTHTRVRVVALVVVLDNAWHMLCPSTVLVYTNVHIKYTLKHVPLYNAINAHWHSSNKLQA